MRRMIFLIVCILLIPCVALADLTVYFLDVGQGDCAIVECDGEAMIIDGGLPGQSQKVYSFIKDELHFNTFLCVVATHPDNDHIGGLPAAFRAVKDSGKFVKYIYSPVKEYESQRFTDLKNAVSEAKLKIKVPTDGQEMDLGKAKVTFYNCEAKKSVARAAADWLTSWLRRDDPEENEDNNNMSLVVKIEYGETSFLFVGDIENETEKDLVNSLGDKLRANVLKVAHHGSNSSSSIDFLTKVDPTYAIISCGTGNKYKHPNQETLNELQQKNVTLYRTDLQGDITCSSDGKTITFTTKTKTQEDLFKAPQ